MGTDPMAHPRNILLAIVGTLVFWGAALVSMLQFGVINGMPNTIGFCIGLVIIIGWYFAIGHHMVGGFINSVAGMSRGGNVAPKGLYEKKVDALIAAKRHDEAIRLAREWGKHDRESAEPILKISGVLFECQQKLPQAIQELEIAVSRATPAETRVAFAVRLAELYRKAGRDREVENLFHRVRSLHPKSPEIERLQ